MKSSFVLLTAFALSVSAVKVPFSCKTGTVINGCLANGIENAPCGGGRGSRTRQCVGGLVKCNWCDVEFDNAAHTGFVEGLEAWCKNKGGSLIHTLEHNEKPCSLF